MNSQTAVRVAFGASLLLSCVFSSANAQSTCNSTAIVVVSSQTLSSNITQTSGSNPCIRVTANNVVLNLGGKTIHCGQVSCENAIVIEGTNVTVKNGSFTGPWAAGVANDVPGGIAVDSEIFDIMVDGADQGVAFPGALVADSVFKNIAVACISTFNIKTPQNALIQQNYCQSDGNGIGLIGPASGNAATVSRNFIRALDNGLVVGGGIVDIEQNVIAEAATPLAIDVSATETLTKNLCEDPDCDLPDDYPFTFNVNW